MPMTLAQGETSDSHMGRLETSDSHKRGQADTLDTKGVHVPFVHTRLGISVHFSVDGGQCAIDNAFKFCCSQDS